MSGVDVDLDLMADISARLDLREPNREALESIVIELSQHYDVDEKPAPFEAVVDSATGVGKTYILAGAIDYLAAKGIRNFAVVAPGLTILRKTVANFTEGAAKSLTGPMNVKPVVVTSENFDTAAMRAEMDDPDRVKLFIFTVQALTKPTTKVGKKTHKFHEGLGAAFYDHLDGLEDLVVFADEHHMYYGDAFSAAIRDLTPHAIVGLTATPHKKTPEEGIIFRYPLAAAIADRLVKTPVIVGRKDDRTDSETKLADGLNLLRVKTELAHAYADENGLPRVNPVMLVVAQTAEEAEEYGAILRSQEFDGGDWADRVLVVHYNAPEEALEALDRVEDVDSPVRVIIAVRMLAEGWDVKNVFVIASMRASVSTILTEQTLGRGLRLPWGRYTDVEMLDTLEVLAHERYEELLKKAGVHITEAFVDQRTRALLRTNAKGQTVSSVETTTVQAPVIELPPAAEGTAAAVAPTPVGGAIVTSVEDRQKEAQKESPATEQLYMPLDDMPTIKVPRLLMTPIESSFSLGDIIDLDPFTKLGQQVASDPDAELRRVKVSARIVEGFDGIRRTELVTSTAVDKVEAARSLFPLEDLKLELVESVLGSPVVPARKGERVHAVRLVDAFVAGLGDKATELLSAYKDRATARLIRLVTDEHRRFAAKPKFEEVVEVVPLGKPRTSRRQVTKDRTGVFRKSLAYNGWRKSLYGVDWFDSEPERAVASAVDDAEDVKCWARLHTGELPILWTSEGRHYNADLVVVDGDDTKWVVEVKRDSEVSSDEVQQKRAAAKRWVNHVNAAEALEAAGWRYLLLSETDIKQAKGSWKALCSLGT